MKIWVSPDPELVPFRDASLAFLREHPSMTLAVHWGMISAVYPFWFNVARQTGRLLALQDQVTQQQIINQTEGTVWRPADRESLYTICYPLLGSLGSPEGFRHHRAAMRK